MHAAPSVTYPVGRSAFAGAATALLAAGGLAAAAAWTLQSHAPGWRQAGAFSLVALASLAALAAWSRSPVGRLHWDGAGWTWEEGGAARAGQAALALDLQSRMLLRWEGQDGGKHWLWVERASDPSHWDALRRAVYSRASAPIPTSPTTGKVTPSAGQPPGAEQ